MSDAPRDRAIDETTWWVVVRADNGYPVLIYADEARAKHIAESNDYRAVKVRVV